MVKTKEPKGINKARYRSLRKICNLYFTYLLNAIGLTPGGSSTVHIYTQTIHRTIQWNRIPRNFEKTYTLLALIIRKLLFSVCSLFPSQMKPR